MSILQNKRIVVGISGGIAAYKTAYFVRLLIKEKAQVFCVMTQSAEKLVGASTFRALTDNPVYRDGMDEVATSSMKHIDLSHSADIIVVAPATANTIAKIAHGIADNLLTTTILATHAPVFLCPAMNVNMWNAEATAENMKTLAKRKGIFIAGPAVGDLACGDQGSGRMIEPDEILFHIKRILSNKDAAGKKIIVTAGPTREALDPVRFISNYSTGKMGFLVAEEAYMRGAEVVLIYGPTHLTPPGVSKLIPVETASEMLSAVRANLKGAKAVIMSAAVADFAPKEKAKKKVKKEDKKTLSLELSRTTDILMWLKQNAPKVVRIGFAAESDNVIAYAREKLLKKGLSLIVANEIGKADSGFAVDTDRAAILSTAKETTELKLKTKRDLACELITAVIKLI